MPQDPYKEAPKSLEAPADDAAVVAPDDATDLPNATRALYIGTAGDLKVTMAKGTVVTFPSHPAGYASLRVKRVWATGTLAAGIRALY